MEIMQYQSSFGPINWQAGFERELAGRSIEEQLRCFALTECSWLKDVPYSELENEIRRNNSDLSRIHPAFDRWSIIVNNGLIVGVAYYQYKDYGRVIEKTPLLPYKGYIYNTTSDNNGSGYKERTWYKYLVCLPYNHSLW